MHNFANTSPTIVFQAAKIAVCFPHFPVAKKKIVVWSTKFPRLQSLLFFPVVYFRKECHLRTNDINGTAKKPKKKKKLHWICSANLVIYCFNKLSILMQKKEETPEDKKNEFIRYFAKKKKFFFRS